MYSARLSRTAMKNTQFKRAQKRVKITVGESIRVMRELQELSQNELASKTGIPQSTISALENDRIGLGLERAKVLARALKCHPGVIAFPGWDEHEKVA
jgi:transcriptional regulator with XRE-family HTH domain